MYFFTEDPSRHCILVSCQQCPCVPKSTSQSLEDIAENLQCMAAATILDGVLRSLKSTVKLYLFIAQLLQASRFHVLIFEDLQYQAIALGSAHSFLCILLFFSLLEFKTLHHFGVPAHVTGNAFNLKAQASFIQNNGICLIVIIYLTCNIRYNDDRQE